MTTPASPMFARANAPATAAAASSIEISVPASSANLGPGFDSLGVALELRNSFEFALAPEGGEFSGQAAGPESAGLILKADNLASLGFRAGWSLARQGEEAPPHSLKVQVHVPQSRGLGSSSTALVAGAAAGFRLAGGDAPDTDAFLNLISALEGHPDNVVPAALGGLVCAAWNGPERRLDGWARTMPAATLRLVALIPDAPLATERARAALPASVPLGEAVWSAARTPLVVEALRSGDLPLLARVCRDKLHEPRRKHLVPLYEPARALAEEFGAAFHLSGAGTTMALWCLADEADALAEALRHLIESEGAGEGLGARALVLEPARDGWLERSGHKGFQLAGAPRGDGGRG